MAGLFKTLVNQFLGKPKPPVFSTTPTSGARYQSSAGLAVRDMVVTAITHETPDAVTIAFKPAGVEPLRYQAGQFMTFIVTLDGVEYRRAFSFSSSPLEPGDPAVTVKRIPNGKVSTWLTQSLKPGDRLRVLGPSGDFVIEPQPGGKRQFVFVAGGSGVTPLMSLTTMLLKREPGTHITLLYGNRRQEDVIFRTRLDELAFVNPSFRVVHVLEHPPVGWTGPVGRLTGDKVRALSGAADGVLYYLCGPEAMMAGAWDALTEDGVAAASIKLEKFVSPAQRKGRGAAGLFPVHFARSNRTVNPVAGQTILEAGLAAGVKLDYSCALGGCGACKVRVKSGAVEMDEPNCLSGRERAAGYALACIASPTEPVDIDA